MSAFRSNPAITLFLLLALWLVPLVPAPAKDGPQMVNWTTLNLNARQSSEIDQLETEWKIIYSQLYPRIEQDRARLRQMLNDPASTPADVMALQNRLNDNEERLRNEATRIFLEKRNRLDTTQKQRLQLMLDR